MRHCPRDGAELIQDVAGEANLRWCQLCSGLWLEDEDLQRATRASWEDWKLPLGATIKGGHLPNTVQCSCPSTETMRTTKKGLVMVDICQACQAVWLDGGELDQLRSHLDPNHKGQWIIVDMLLSLLRESS